MIILFTDYGLTGSYLGQVKLKLYECAPESRVITLMADAPAHNPRASAYLLSAYTQDLPNHSVVFCVIDPGVGSNDHKPVIIKADNRWFVGPDNGLFNIICRTASDISAWEITWSPESLTSTFHGRDLYAPVCAMLDKAEPPPGKEFQWIDRHQWPDMLYEVIYIDHFGNLITGISSNQIPENSELLIAGQTFKQARTFSDVGPGKGFWYKNSSGLVEIALNQANAANLLNVKISDSVELN